MRGSDVYLLVGQCTMPIPYITCLKWHLKSFITLAICERLQRDTACSAWPLGDWRARSLRDCEFASLSNRQRDKQIANVQAAYKLPLDWQYIKGLYRVNVVLRGRICVTVTCTDISYCQAPFSVFYCFDHGDDALRKIRVKKRNI